MSDTIPSTFVPADIPIPVAADAPHPVEREAIARSLAFEVSSTIESLIPCARCRDEGRRTGQRRGAGHHPALPGHGSHPQQDHGDVVGGDVSVAAGVHLQCPNCGSERMSPIGWEGRERCLGCGAEWNTRRPTTDDNLTFEAVRTANRSRARRWHTEFPDTRSDGWSGADWSNAMGGECGEAMNVVKKLRRGETNTRGAVDPHRDVLLEKLGDELADTLIYADLLAQFYGIDLDAAVIRKFNAISVREGLPERLP
jgi:NTP pyrophosphatase (non-canonical NTP hydrolase)